MTVGNRIKAARIKNRWTQKQLYERSGVAEITIRQYENGKRTPRLDLLQKISAALGVPVSDLLDIPESFADVKRRRDFELVQRDIRENSKTQGTVEPVKKIQQDLALYAAHAVEALLYEINGELYALTENGLISLEKGASKKPLPLDGEDLELLERLKSQTLTFGDLDAELWGELRELNAEDKAELLKNAQRMRELNELRNLRTPPTE